MKLYFTYILKCFDNSYYTGMTNDLERRLVQHHEGLKRDCYTFERRPVELKWYLHCTNPTEAIKIEKQIKGWSRRKKTALIEENWQDLVEFSKIIPNTGLQIHEGLRQAQTDIWNLDWHLE